MRRNPLNPAQLDDARRAAELRFDVDRALGLAQLSEAAYLPFGSDELRQAVNRAGFRLRGTVERGATELLVAQNHETAAIVFRGTTADTWHDWKTNLEARFRPVKGRAGAVHSGFSKAVDQVAAELRDALETLADDEPDRPIDIAGHSLGGACASVAYGRFASRCRQLRPEVTFGSPRVFRRDVDGLAPGLRFVNAGDLVPRVPLVTMGYGHRDRLEYFTRDGALLPAPGWWVTLPRFAFVKAIAPGSGWRDHRVGRYVGKLVCLRRSIPWSTYRSA